MGSKTSIEWTRGADGSPGATWNPIRARLTVLPTTLGQKLKGALGWHCEHVSEGCRNCYSEAMNRRLGTGLDFKPGHRKDVEIFLDEKMLLAPLKWQKPRRIFVNSMTDTFADFVTDEMLDRMFAVMALCPQHSFQVLTKRPARMCSYMEKAHERIASEAMEMAPVGISIAKVGLVFAPRHQPSTYFEQWPLKNAWLGLSCEDQATADERIPLLLQTPAAVRFISAEPLLGRIDISDYLVETARTNWDWYLDWVIAGGESGPHARPMHPDWVRSLRDQCAASGVPFFFKQWGQFQYGPYVPSATFGGDGYVEVSHGNCVAISRGVRLDENVGAIRVGKKAAAGRLLDGVEHNGMPT